MLVSGVSKAGALNPRALPEAWPLDPSQGVSIGWFPKASRHVEHAQGGAASSRRQRLLAGSGQRPVVTQETVRQAIL